MLATNDYLIASDGCSLPFAAALEVSHLNDFRSVGCGLN